MTVAVSTYSSFSSFYLGVRLGRKMEESLLVAALN